LTLSTQQSDRGDRAATIEAHREQVRLIAARVWRRLPSTHPLDFDDLLQAGFTGLIGAVEKFDPERGATLKTYADRRILGAIIDSLRAGDWMPRQLRRQRRALAAAERGLAQTLGHWPDSDELAGALGISVEDYGILRSEIHRANVVLRLEDFSYLRISGRRLGLPSERDKNAAELVPAAADTHGAAQAADTAAHVRAAVARLPGKMRLVIVLYYYGRRDLTMLQIGAILGVKESRVSQIHTKAIERLRKKLAFMRH
jgi:RNA polymerase sigma factor for flagellar operon FliA